MPYFHCSSTMLEPGAVIMPGNWGRIIQSTGWPHNQAFREAVFEYVREREFPEKPSRLTSLFFFDDENEARFYTNSDGRQQTMIPYEVELLDPIATKHVADWRGLQPRGLTNLEWIRDYWAGQMLPPYTDAVWTATCREVIAPTAARITRRL